MAVGNPDQDVAPPGGLRLSPWPQSGPELDTARRYVRANVAGRTLESDQTLDAVCEAASALVEQYGPRAPQRIRDEAVVRFAGYLSQSDFGGITAETSVGDQRAEYHVQHADMFRRCGAAGLLSPWRHRRAGVLA